MSGEHLKKKSLQTERHTKPETLCVEHSTINNILGHNNIVNSS